MEKHLSLVVVLNLVYRALAVFGGFVVLALAIWFDRLLEMVSRWDVHGIHEIPQFVLDIVPAILVVVAVIILLISAVGIAGAIGVHKRKEWGRILLLVISFFTLIRIPLGTLLGGYTIWVLFNDETMRLFKPVSAPPAEKPAG
jgi:hypothetical protein